MQSNPVVDALQKAVKGLLYISESEAELTPFFWQNSGDLNEKSVLGYAGIKKAPVEVASLDSFFQTVSEEDKARFDKLAKVLKEQLTGVKVYKIGAEAEKQVFVVGKTRDGQWAGVKTTVVET